MNKALLCSIMLGFSANILAKPLTLNLDLEKITVSGLSSGGFMANQFHIAYSDWVNGAGIIAGGPYYCAQNDIAVALAQCVNKSESKLSLDTLSKTVKQYQSQQKIAPLENLKDSKVWLFHGTSDTRVISPVSNALYDQYALWVDSDDIQYINDKPFAHLFPTQHYGSDCETSESPFIGNCEYDAAGAMLNFLYTELNPKTTKPSGKLVSIDQKALGGEAAQSLADEGFVYVPKTCQDQQQCKVHVSFHGCNQNAQTIGQQYATKTGINNWADTNRIVVVYPQTSSSMFMPLNPQGCWDWWGYTDAEYATRDAQQIQAVKNIIHNLQK